MSTFLLRRPVDWSLLTNGFHIPTEFHPLVYAMPGGELHHGDKRGVKIMIDDEVFDAKASHHPLHRINGQRHVKHYHSIAIVSSNNPQGQAAMGQERFVIPFPKWID